MVKATLDHHQQKYENHFAFHHQDPNKKHVYPLKKFINQSTLLFYGSGNWKFMTQSETHDEIFYKIGLMHYNSSTKLNK